MLSNAYFLAKFRFDTAENEPAKNLLILNKFSEPTYPGPTLPSKKRPWALFLGLHHPMGLLVGVFFDMFSARVLFALKRQLQKNIHFLRSEPMA